MSLLDTDLYKLTMQQVLLHHFPEERAEYKFYNRRAGDLFTRESFDWFQDRVRALADVRLTATERAWLEMTCPYFKAGYLDFLEELELRPDEQVEASFVPDPAAASGDGRELGAVEIVVRGKWVETILYEVPLMALLSEAYFLHTDRDWTLDGVKDAAAAKCKKLLAHNIAFSEFGTRRRRSAAVHDLVVQGLIAGQADLQAAGYAGRGRLAGTSNVLLAMRYGLAPVGTIAHEHFMGVAALKGYEGVNARALDLWEEGDSGDPLAFARRVKAVYEALGVGLEGKTIVFSDALDVDRCIEIQALCDELGIGGAAFGVGTFLTNDFRRASDPAQPSRALNIVIKLSKIDGKDCVKISDELTKNTGAKAEVERVKRELAIHA